MSTKYLSDPDWLPHMLADDFEAGLKQNYMYNLYYF